MSLPTINQHRSYRQSLQSSSIYSRRSEHLDDCSSHLASVENSSACRVIACICCSTTLRSRSSSYTLINWTKSSSNHAQDEPHICCTLPRINQLFADGIAMLETPLGNLIQLGTCKRQCMDGGLQCACETNFRCYRWWFSSALLSWFTSKAAGCDEINVRVQIDRCTIHSGQLLRTRSSTSNQTFTWPSAADDLRRNFLNSSWWSENETATQVLLLAQAVLSSIILCATAFSLSTVTSCQRLWERFLCKFSSFPDGVIQRSQQTGRCSCDFSSTCRSFCCAR